MTHSISVEWCRKMMALDEHVTPGVGALAARPYVEAEALSLRTEETRVAFARFVNMARRKRGLTIEKLAEDADIEIGELMSIEEDAHHEPDLRTVWSLSNIFGVSQTRLMELAGLAVAKDSHWLESAVRYAARSAPIEELTPDEQIAFEGLIAVLSEKAN